MIPRFLSISLLPKGERRRKDVVHRGGHGPVHLPGSGSDKAIEKVRLDSLRILGEAWARCGPERRRLSQGSAPKLGRCVVPAHSCTSKESTVQKCAILIPIRQASI
jgi:hypothetical protein